MSELSPAAQAVLDAANGAGCYGPDDVLNDSRWIAAAAIRAAADQIQMKEPFGDTDADAGVFAAHQAIHAGLRAIADELEAQ